MKQLLAPDRFVASVHDIDLDELTSLGVRAMLLDLDNTLLPRDTNVVPEALTRWAGRLAAHELRVCLVSNNWHHRVKLVADQLGFDLVDKALKPLPFAFRAALGKTGSRASEAVVVGDQLFTDVLGGNAIGAMTVLVQPLSRTDLPHTLLLRKIEARVLHGRGPATTTGDMRDGR